MRKIPLFVILWALGLAIDTFGQGKYGFEIGAFGGRSFWRERTFQVGPPQVPADAPNIDLGFSYKDDFMYGARFNLLSRGHWGGEFTYDYQRSTLTLSRESFDSVELDGAIHHFFYNMIFYPLRYSDSKVIPFATGGVGLAAYSLSSSAREKAADPQQYGIGNLREMDKRFAYNYGFGVKAKLSSRLGVRFDFRHIFSDVPSYGLPKESPNPSQTVLPIQGKLQMFEGSVGIYLHLSSGLQF